MARVASLLLFAVLGASCTAVSPPANGSLAVADAWMRPVPQGGNGAVYLTVTNSAGKPDRLLSARCADAAAAELHQVVMDGDRMSMVPVEDGLEIPGGGRLELSPGGHHLMLIDLARDLPVGGRLEVVLELERAGELVVQVPVAFTGPPADSPRTSE